MTIFINWDHVSSVTCETILTNKIEKMSFYEKHIQNKPFLALCRMAKPCVWYIILNADEQNNLNYIFL